MAKPLRPKRGTTAKNDAFVGLASEITVDTEKHSIRVHDGVTAGGHEILPDCLPKSGGAMTGSITLKGGNNSIVAPTDDSFIEIEGGTTYDKGAKLSLYGKDYSNGGQFRLSSHDGTSYKHLVGYPNGDMTWCGNEVLTTANGLPLSGGTLVGNIIFDRDSGHIFKQDANGRMLVRGGTSTGNDGASLYLNGEGYSSNGGCFILKTAKGDTSSEFYGNPNGTLMWGGKNIVRSVNNTSADANGNVSISIPSGTVSQKLNTSVSVTGSSSTTKSVTGLTANKPVFIGMKKTSSTSGRVSASVSSGTAINHGDTSNSSNEQQIDISKVNGAKWVAVVPTSTSITIRVHNWTTSETGTATLVVYQ